MRIGQYAFAYKKHLLEPLTFAFFGVILPNESFESNNRGLKVRENDHTRYTGNWCHGALSISNNTSVGNGPSRSCSGK